MGDIVKGDKIVFGNNSRMIKIEMNNYFGSDSEDNDENRCYSEGGDVEDVEVIEEFKDDTNRNEIKNGSKRGRPKKAGKKILKSFIYRAYGDKDTNLRLQNLYNGLLQLKWIAADTKLKIFIRIFSGEDTTCRITWIGDINTLAELFKELVTRKGFVKLPEGESIWVMVNARFWEKEGNHEFGNDRLRSTSTPTASKEMIDLLVKLMDPDLPLESLKEAIQTQR